MKKEKQKIFNYDTLWDNFLKDWYEQLNNMYDKKIINGLKDDYDDFKEFYNNYFRYESNYKVYEKYGYKTLLSLLNYAKDDLFALIHTLDDDMQCIIRDYYILLNKYEVFYNLILDCERFRYFK